MQKKTKKQVQFDIVPVAVEKTNEDDSRHSETATLAVTENRDEHTPPTTPTPPTPSTAYNLQHRQDQKQLCSGKFS